MDFEFQPLVDISPDAIVLQTTENGRIVFANQAARRLVGVDESIDMVGLDFVDFVHPDYREDARSRNRIVLAGGDPQPISYALFVRNDGTSLHVERSVTPCQHEGKAAFISLVRDISARYKAQQELADSKARLSSILMITPVAIIAISEVGIIELFNTGAENVFGYKASEVIGRNINMLLPERYHKSHSALVAAFAGSKETMRQMTDRNVIHALHRDGREFPAEASVSREDHPTGIVMTVALRDITDRIQAEEQIRMALIEAELANQAKSDFLATMSHELRTPLNAIIGFSDMIEGQYFGALGSDKYEEYAHDIQASSKHLLSLVNDILDLSAIEAGKQPLIKEDISIREMAKESMQIIATAAKEKAIECSVNISDDQPPLYADRRAVRQILFNLLSNAIKYTNKGGRIRLSATASNGLHAIEISDSGVGIPVEKISILTDPFVKTESNPHKAQEGAGLGLAIVKSLVELHGGEIHIQSEVGVGTNVTLTLPGKSE